MTEGPVGGARAVGQAFRLVHEGDLDVALCGGTDASSRSCSSRHTAAPASSPATTGRPGLVPGEGSGLLVLEEAERAIARGARMHGEVLGYASAAGDGRLGGGDDAAAAADAAALGVIDTVLEEAKTAPDLVSLHGDGIPAHDRAEMPRSRVRSAR